jgi:hypothetical protein
MEWKPALHMVFWSSMLELGIPNYDCRAERIKVTGKFHNCDHGFSQIRGILNATGKQHSSSVPHYNGPGAYP